MSDGKLPQVLESRRQRRRRRERAGRRQIGRLLLLLALMAATGLGLRSGAPSLALQLWTEWTQLPPAIPAVALPAGAAEPGAQGGGPGRAAAGANRSPSVSTSPLPPDMIVADYEPLFKATESLAAGNAAAALAALPPPPEAGFRAYLHHSLRAQALRALGDHAGATAAAERAYSLAVGRDWVDAAVLLAGVRAAGGDAGGATDLLLRLIPAAELRYRGPQRDDLLQRLEQTVPKLSPVAPADQDRLLQAGDLLLRYGRSAAVARLLARPEWPAAESIGHARLQVRLHAFRGELEQALTALAALVPRAGAEVPYLRYLQATYLDSLGRPATARAVREEVVSQGRGAYWAGQALHRLVENHLEAGETERAASLLGESAAGFRATAGWQAAAWSLAFTRFARGDAPGTQRVLDLLQPVAAQDPRFLFWSYQLTTRRGEAGAEARLAELLRGHPLTYYALVARERWPQAAAATSGPSPITAPSVQTADPNPDLQRRLDMLEQVAQGAAAPAADLEALDLATPAALWRAGQREAAAGELRQRVSSSKTWELPYLLARWEAERGRHREAVLQMTEAVGRLQRPVPVSVTAPAPAPVPAPAPASSPVPAPMPPPPLLRGLFPRPYADTVVREATAHGVDPLFVYAIMREESTFEPLAYSVADAAGLMQIIPATARGLAEQAGMRGFDPRDLFVPEISIRLGVRHLAWLLSYFKGDMRLAAAGYNAGHGSVDRWLRQTPATDLALFVERIPFPETQEYVRKVDQAYRIYRLLYAP